MTLGVRSFKNLLYIEILAELSPLCFYVRSFPSSWSLNEHLCSGSLSTGSVCCDSLAVHRTRVMPSWFCARRWDSCVCQAFLLLGTGNEYKSPAGERQLEVNEFFYFQKFLPNEKVLLSNFGLVWIKVHCNVKKTSINLVEAIASHEVFWVEDLIEKNQHCTDCTALSPLLPQTLGRLRQ